MIPRRIRRPNVRRSATSLFMLAVASLLCAGLSLSPALAQGGGSKQAQSFQKKSEETRKSIEKAREQIQGTLEVYNSIVEQKAKKLPQAYKKFSGEVDKCEKAAKDVQSKAKSMNKDADKFFAGWEKEIEGYASPSFKEQGKKRLGIAREHYDNMIARMKEAGEIYQPMIASLQDQVQFLGRDLSPAAISALDEPAKDVNRKAEDLFHKIDQILNAELEDEGKANGLAKQEDEAAGEREMASDDADDEGAMDPEDGGKSGGGSDG